MFNFLKKKRVDDVKVDEFVNWFLSVEKEIIDSFAEGNPQKYLDIVEEKLIKVYSDGFNGAPEFEFGISPDMTTFELNIYHLNNRFLIAATTAIKEKLQPLVAQRWTVNIGE